VQTRFTGGRAGIRLESARQDSRLPGSLSLAQFDADPRQTSTPNDFGSLDTDRANVFAEYRLGAVDLAAELSHRERNVRSNYLSFGSNNAYDGRQNQFSPRARWLSDVGGMQNELVGGLDFTRLEAQDDGRRSRAPTRASRRKPCTCATSCVSIRPTMAASPSAHATRTSTRTYVDVVGGVAPDNGRSQSQNAWEAQASYRVHPLVEVYAKAGQSYRVANVDENGYRSSLDILKAQTSHDLELGTTLRHAPGDDSRTVTARVFRHR
jgi:iron complex outermembrane receptor protein